MTGAYPLHCLNRQRPNSGNLANGELHVMDHLIRLMAKPAVINMNQSFVIRLWDVFLEKATVATGALLSDGEVAVGMGAGLALSSGAVFLSHITLCLLLVLRSCFHCLSIGILEEMA